jgi:uncharacterized protein (DUF58 family)
LSTPTAPVADKPKNRFIDPKVLIRIQNMELLARTVVEGFVTGLHQSPYKGFSVDFAEYRQYMPGDEIRRIDWNVYGRSDKLFIKLYEGETNTRVTILLDMSGSMNYGSGEVRKGDYAKMLAACLSYFAYHQRDAAGIMIFDSEVRSHIPASRRNGQLFSILHEIEKAVPEKGTELRRPLRYLAEILNRRGIIILISDFYDDPANILAGLKVLKAKGNDVMTFHIMDDFELTFPFEDMAQFEDMETKEKLHVIPEYLRDQYLKVVGAHIDTLKKGLKSVQIDYTLMNTSKPLDAGLFSYLAARAHTL